MQDRCDSNVDISKLNEKVFKKFNFFFCGKVNQLLVFFRIFKDQKIDKKN
jgi:hypothetical protein